MKRTFLMCSTVAVGIVLSACSSAQQDLKRDDSYTATFDYQNNLIIKPLTEYLAGEKNINTYNRAHAIVMDRCLKSEGYSYPQYEASELLDGSREYGMWNTDYTQKYGFGTSYETLKQNQNLKEINNIPEEYIEKCYTENQETLETFAPVDEFSSLAGSLEAQAKNKASQDPRWAEARQTWWQCLSDKGLTPEKEDGAWGSQEAVKIADQNLSDPAVHKESIRVATIEAQCSQDTGMAQKLADLEAAYQGPLIEENRVALNQEKETMAEHLKNAEQYIAHNQ